MEASISWEKWPTNPSSERTKGTVLLVGPLGGLRLSTCLEQEFHCVSVSGRPIPLVPMSPLTPFNPSSPWSPSGPGGPKRAEHIQLVKINWTSLKFLQKLHLEIMNTYWRWQKTHSDGRKYIKTKLAQLGLTLILDCSSASSSFAQLWGWNFRVYV